MTPADLAAFERECQQRFGWSRRRVYMELDLSYDRYMRLLNGETSARIPRHIALACAAILAGVEPYRSAA